MAKSTKTSSKKTRVKSDAFGPLEFPPIGFGVPQTQRSLHNFRIGTERMPIEIVHALGLIKRAAADVNRDLGSLDRKRAAAIGTVAKISPTASSTAISIRGGASFFVCLLRLSIAAFIGNHFGCFNCIKTPDLCFSFLSLAVFFLYLPEIIYCKRNNILKMILYLFKLCFNAFYMFISFFDIEF